MLKKYFFKEKLYVRNLDQLAKEEKLNNYIDRYTHTHTQNPQTFNKIQNPFIIKTFSKLGIGHSNSLI